MKNVTTIKAMWFLEDKLAKISIKKKQELPPQKSFNLAFFRRNTVYLQASYLLGSIGFNNPSRNIQRTVYETILRGYYFLIEPEEAKQYHSALGTDQEKEFLWSRKHYGHSFLTEKLFKEETISSYKRVYELFCISSHAEIKGLSLDFPKFSEENIEDRLQLVLSLAFGSIQLITELFFDSISQELKTIVSKVLEEIVITLGEQVPLFEPNKETYQSRIRLKNGNFKLIL